MPDVCLHVSCFCGFRTTIRPHPLACLRCCCCCCCCSCAPATPCCRSCSPATPVLLTLLQTLRVPSAVSDQEGVQVEVTRLLVASYFDIVRKNLQASAAGGCVAAAAAAGPACHATAHVALLTYLRRHSHALLPCHAVPCRPPAPAVPVQDAVPKALMHCMPTSCGSHPLTLLPLLCLCRTLCPRLSCTLWSTRCSAACSSTSSASCTGRSCLRQSWRSGRTLLQRGPSARR
jgi:hypothetical protein